MSRMRVTAAQILPDCPMVVGFGGWGVLGSELPATGEHGPSVGYKWADLPADNDKEFWVRITTQPASGTLVMWPDSSFEYDGPSTTFEAQLAVDAADVDTPQPVAIPVGATAAVSPSRGRYAVSGHAPAVLQGAAQAIAPQAGHVQARGYAPTIGQAQTIAPTRAQAVAAGHAPIVVKGVRVDPQTGRVEWAGHAPTIAQGGARTVSPAVGRVRAMGWAPSVTTMATGGYPSSVTITVPSGRTITLRPR